MRDLVHNIKAVASIAPAVRSASVDGDGVDLLGFDSAALIVSVGAVTGAGNMTPKLQESDTDVAGSYTDVAADHLQGAGLANPLVANSTTKIGYRGFKRFIRAVLTLNSGTSVSCDALIILGNAAERAVA